MLEVVKDTVEENKIEGPQPLGFQIINVHQERCCIRLPRGPNDIEAAYGIWKGVDAYYFSDTEFSV
jgi:hypothetical protein